MGRPVPLGPAFRYRYVIGDTTALHDQQDDAYINAFLLMMAAGISIRQWAPCYIKLEGKRSECHGLISLLGQSASVA
jgi:hypothetical protein